VLDMSAVCAGTTDMRPNRAVALAQMAQAFIREFFDQNPLSQMSVLVMRHGRTEALSELSPTPEVHMRALTSSLQTGGEVSLQNMLQFCTQVRFTPSVPRIANSFLFKGKLKPSCLLQSFSK
jgi:transcription initiation factor TFIIH subunit 2